MAGMQDFIQLDLCPSQRNITLKGEFIANFQFQSTIRCHKAGDEHENLERGRAMRVSADRR